MSEIETLLLEKRKALLEEKLRRAKLPLNKYKPCEDPERNQLAFHKSQAFIRILSGGNQSGKSLAAAAEIAWTLLGNHPHQEIKTPQKVWATSVEYRTLYEGIWRHLRPDGRNVNGAAFLPDYCIKKMGPKVPGYDIPTFVEVKFKQGTPDEGVSRIDFISAEGGESARRRFQSAAVNLIVADEEIDEIIVQEILVRLLATNGRFVVSATMIRSEPWILELEDRAVQGDPSVSWVTLNTDKNEYLNEEKRNQIFAMMSDEEREVRKKGKSRRAHGLMYAVDKTHFIDPFNVNQLLKEDPQGYEIILGLDPGFRIFAGIWILVNHRTKLIYAIQEMYIKQLQSLQQIADYIKFYETQLLEGTTFKRSDIIRIIDPAAVKHLETGEISILQQLSSYHDIHCMPAINKIEPGITAVQDLLNLHPIHHVPYLRFFRTLKNTLDELKNYRLRRDNNPLTKSLDKPLSKKDHLMDCLRYVMIFLRNVPTENTKGFGGNSRRNLVDEYVSKKGKNKVIHEYLGSEV